MDGQDPTQQGTTGATGSTQTKRRISAAVAAKFPDLEELVLKTESMTDEERDYWFQILPIMTDQQVEKLRGILIHEKEQLSKLDSEYEKELSKINDKHLSQWEADEARKKREERQAAESAHEAEEKAAEEALLGTIDELDSEPEDPSAAPLAG